MAVRKIMLFPEDKAVLRAKSNPVQSMNQKTKRLIADLKDTLLACQDGVGLAAPQINEHLSVVVIRLGAKNDWDNEAGPPIAFVNPEIIESGEEQKDFDGCLSFPGLYGETIHPHFLRVTGLDEDGNPLDQIYRGFDAVVVHHEIDHLNGTLFIDRISSINDLYRTNADDSGRLVRVPLKQVEKELNASLESFGLLRKTGLEEIIKEVANEQHPSTRLDDTKSHHHFKQHHAA